MTRMLLVTVALWLFACSKLGDPPPDPDTERAKRETPVTEVAPAPVPVSRAGSLPLLGADGADEDGYPLRYVDRPKLRSLLAQRRFDELTRIFEELQTAFEGDFHKEYWPMDAAEAVGTAEPELGPLLDAWVAAHPRSFAPYLARGTHWVSAAGNRRGGKWLKDTPKADINAMNDAIARAIPDLERAIQLRPKAVAALRREIVAVRHSGSRKQMRALLERAWTACPPCLQPRIAYIYTLMPRWGGSHEAMLAFARERLDPSNPKLRLLRGYVQFDKAEALTTAKRYPEALAAIEGACAVGPHWEFLEKKAKIELLSKDFGAALQAVDRAAKIRPGNPSVLGTRMRILYHLKRWEAAGRDLRALVQIDPTDQTARSYYPNIVKGLIYVAWEASQAGRRDEGLRIIDLAAELAPNDADVERRRAWIVISGSKDIEALKENVRQRPDDFRAVQELDYALARQRKLEEILPLWNDFLARQPEHGRAHLERAGTLLHLGRIKDAVADAKRACELGVTGGCAMAKRLGAQDSK